MAFSDRDYAGLMLVADAGMAKQAADYGNMPNLSINGAFKALTGKSLGTAGDIADMGAVFIPGVGNAVAAYDAVRNTADMVSDLKRGKWLSALGNGGSALMNGFFAVPVVGNIGRGIQAGLKGINRGLRGVRGGARVAKALNRPGKALHSVGGRMARYGNGIAAARSERALARSTARQNARLAAHPTLNDPTISRWLMRRGYNALDMGRDFGRPMAGFMAAGTATAIGDARYDQKLENEFNTRWDRVHGSGAYQGGWYPQTPNYSSYPAARYGYPAYQGY